MNTRNKYEEEEKNLASKSAAFVQYLMRRGLLVDQRVLNEDAQRRRQEVARKAYHNTELLLTSYREIVWALESVPDQIASELQMPFATLDELIDRIDLELGMENKRLESRLNSVTKSRLLIDRINEAVSVLKTKPKDGKDLYRVIYKTFMDPVVSRNMAIRRRQFYYGQDRDGNNLLYEGAVAEARVRKQLLMPRSFMTCESLYSITKTISLQRKIVLLQ